VGQCLRDRKPTPGRIEVAGEERQRDLVCTLRSLPECGGGRVETFPVVFEQLTSASDRVFDRVAVARQRELGRQFDRASQRLEIRAKRIRTAVGIPSHGRRDVREQVVARDEDAVALEADVTVGVAREVEHPPAVQRVSLVQKLGVVGRPDERTRHLALAEHVAGDRGRRPVALEPRCDSLGPVGTPPHGLALRVVQLALVRGHADQCDDVRAGTDVVRMEVSDHKADEGLVEGRRDAAPTGPRLGEPKARVDSGPPLAAPQQVNVYVTGRKRERKGDAPDVLPDLHSAHSTKRTYVLY
jgi:hypothetical protein